MRNVSLLVRLFIAVGSIALLSSAVTAQKTPKGDYVEPKLWGGEKPDYPVEARVAGLEGDLSVQVLVDKEGNVKSAVPAPRIGRPCGHVDFSPLVSIEQAAVKAALASKFKPALLNGKPVEGKTWVTLTFRLPQGPQRPISPSLTKSAVKLPPPEPSPFAVTRGAPGTVVTKVYINEQGNVVRAYAISGPPLLKESAEVAACRAKFVAKFVDGKAISYVGTVEYNYLRK